MGNYIIPNIPVLATQLNDTDLFEKADGPASGQSQRVTALVAKSYMQSGLVIQSQTVPLDSLSRVYSISHGLSGVPKYVRIVFLCVAPDANTGYVAGQEISQTAVQLSNSPFQCPSYYADSTTISALNISGFVGNENTWSISRSDGLGNASPSDFNNFQLKFYYA